MDRPFQPAAGDGRRLSCPLSQRALGALKQSACLFEIAVDLRRQLLQRRKRLLLPQLLTKVDLQFLAVEISRIVQEMGFHPQSGGGLG